MKILVALNKSMSSKMVVDFLIDLPLCPDDIHITLFHLFRKGITGEELMGPKFIEEQKTRFREILEETKERLLESGFREEYIKTEMTVSDYPAISDGIIDQFNKDNYNLVVIGRKRMTKAEEFVLGDPSVKLIRALTGTAVMVVKGK